MNKVITTSDITLNLSQLIDEIDTVIVKERGELNILQNENKNAIERVNNLKALGFINAQAVKDNTELIEKIKKKESLIRTSKQTTEYIDKYALMFPGYKFVPDAIFVSVMKKYNIYNCESKYYTKDVPDKNIEDILLFKRNFSEIMILRHDDDVFDVIDIDTQINVVKGISATRTYRWDSTLRFNSYRKAYIHNNFFIAAPLSDFNFGDSGKTRAVILQEKNSVRVENIKVDDPIVNVKVPSGYIIVTAWDKEALDPEILNANNN